MLTSNADMNDYVTPGNYFCVSNVVAETLSNCPFTHAFNLKVEFSNGAGLPCQIYREYDTGRIAYRVQPSSSSSSWSQFVYFSDDAKVQANTESYMFTASNEYKADCDDITQPGLCKQVITPSAGHSPGFYSYILVLYYKTGNIENLTQVAFPYNNNNAMKIRYRNSGLWSNWF